MEKKTLAMRVLVAVGTILALFPVVATIATSIAGSIMNKKILVDYLMPAELGLFYLVGGACLVMAAFLAKSRIKLLVVSFFLAEALLVALQIVAEASGLASGEIAPELEKTYMFIVGTMLGLHILCMILTDAGAILLWKDVLGPVFKRRSLG